jgi:hypothetical protein
MSKENNSNSKLHRELIELLDGIDDEGLLFLIEQANILRYNMQVDKINEEKAKLPRNNSNDKKSSQEKSKDPAVKILPQENNNSFILQINTVRAFMSRQDFTAMVKVAQSEDGIDEVAKRLFNWFMRERKDILIDANISKSASPLLKEIVKAVREKYKVQL